MGICYYNFIYLTLVPSIPGLSGWISLVEGCLYGLALNSDDFLGMIFPPPFSIVFWSGKYILSWLLLLSIGEKSKCNVQICTKEKCDYELG
jgi:hypothetical protein